MNIFKHTSESGKVVFSGDNSYVEHGETFKTEGSSDQEYLLAEAVGSNPYKKASDFKVVSQNVGGSIVLGFTYA